MPIKVVMPQLGESVEEATVTKWLIEPGDTIEEYEPLLEVNTDKVDSEIPSPASGVLLEVIVPEGTTVQAGTLLAWIGDADESAPDESAPRPAESAEEPAPSKAEPQLAAAVREELPETPPPGRDRKLGFISPVVARIADEEQIDLHQVEGTGRGGRITKKDVLAYLERRKAAPRPAAPPAPAKAITGPKASPAGEPPAGAFAGITPGEVLPLTPVRKAIAEHMVMSKRTSPHVSTIMEADLSRVFAHREANKAAFGRDGANLTFTAYFISAAIAALKAYPVVNSSFSEEGIRLHRQINIGMATSLGEGGLIVPVIKGADGLSLLGLARAINDLAERARSGNLQPDEVRGGTFTITNHGTSGSLFATPIINQPQCAILGVGVIQKRVVVISDEKHGDTIAIRPMVYLSLTFDHRILDGAIADYFLGEVVKSLQNWQ